MSYREASYIHLDGSVRGMATGSHIKPPNHPRPTDATLRPTDNPRGGYSDVHKFPVEITPPWVLRPRAPGRGTPCGRRSTTGNSAWPTTRGSTGRLAHCLPYCLQREDNDLVWFKQWSNEIAGELACGCMVSLAAGLRALVIEHNDRVHS